MAKEQKKLGRQLLDTLKNVTALIAGTTDPDKIEGLIELRGQLLDQIGELVDKNLRKASEEYAAAAQGLEEASEAIQKALKGMETVATAISVTAKAVDLVAKVVTA